MIWFVLSSSLTDILTWQLVCPLDGDGQVWSQYLDSAAPPLISRVDTASPERQSLVSIFIYSDCVFFDSWYLFVANHFLSQLDKQHCRNWPDVRLINQTPSVDLDAVSASSLFISSNSAPSLSRPRRWHLQAAVMEGVWAPYCLSCQENRIRADGWRDSRGGMWTRAERMDCCGCRWERVWWICMLTS